MEQDIPQAPIKFVALGHVDTGKSTMSGHLLYKCGYITEHSMNMIKEKAKADKMEGWIWARVLDIYEEEMNRGKTHEFDTITFENKINGMMYQLIDTPGHKSFVRSMIEGISENVNIGVLMISMKDNEFISAFGGGMLKEHLILARAVGIESLILVANKMDIIGWDEKECKKKVTGITRYLVKVLNWPKENLYVVPISAFDGTGLMDTDGIPEWYKGKSFIETLNDLSEKNVKIPLTTELIDSDRFICRIRYIGNANNIIEGYNLKVKDDSPIHIPPSIITTGYHCIGHINGTECEMTIDKIKIETDKKRKFLRTGEEGLCIIKMRKKQSVQEGMKVILRKNENTIGFGEITKICL